MGYYANKSIPQIAQSPAPLKSPQYKNWALIADSDFVVVGQLTVPLNSVSDSLRTKNYRYEEIALKTKSTLKGTNTGQTVKIKFYTQPVAYSPSPDTLLQLHGQQVVAFLSLAGDVDEDDNFSASGIYFAGYTPTALQPYNKEIVDAISREVENQKRIANHFKTSREGSPDKFHKQVADLIEQALNKETQEEAFNKLLIMGPKAVPSIIQLMDDRRRLPLQQMNITNRSPNAFEATAHYGPKVMVDALSIILNQLAHESFGSIYNGGSEQERKRVVQAWRVYLHYQTMGVT